ncbi:MAG: hypothetical protein IKW62_01660 [Clostridia bacterium]|nr:hypothetical protein [Clostridia bacterium]
MNNKILARVVAVVLAVMMLGTVSFAADKVITPDAPSAGVTAQTTKTVLAFATDNANANTVDTANGDVIVALIQQEEDLPTTITIDDAKITDKDYIVVLFGGSEGATSKSVIDLATAAKLDFITVYDKLTIGEGEEEKTYTNVAYAKFSFAVPANKTAASYGIKFNSYDAEGEAVGNEKDFNSTTVVAGGGTVNFGAVVFGVPYDELQGTVKAMPYVNYAE